MVFFAISDHDFFCCFLTFVRVSVSAIGGFAIKAIDKSFVGLVRKVLPVISFEKFFALTQQRRFVQIS